MGESDQKPFDATKKRSFCPQSLFINNLTRNMYEDGIKMSDMLNFLTYKIGFEVVVKITSFLQPISTYIIHCKVFDIYGCHVRGSMGFCSLSYSVLPADSNEPPLMIIGFRVTKI